MDWIPLPHVAVEEVRGHLTRINRQSQQDQVRFDARLALLEDRVDVLLARSKAMLAEAEALLAEQVGCN